MPPKVRVSKEEIIQTALKLVRQGGEQAINARAIASALGCSTQPVFYNFETMEELAEAIRQEAYGIYLGFIKRETEQSNYPSYKSMGMAYIRFAKEERELFKLLFMQDRTGKDTSPTLDFEEAVAYIINASGLNREAAVRIHMELWSCVHGIAVMTATSFLSLEWEFISDMLSDVYVGVLSRYTMGEKQ
jgi:AcrR family transcriptional regulator